MEQQIHQDCKAIIELVTVNVLSKVNTREESRAFFAKMAGDYYRYMSEVLTGEK